MGVQGEDLRAFMRTVGPSGGDGYREAVEIGLVHANLQSVRAKEEGAVLSQVVIIGDAPPNESPNQVAEKRERHGPGWHGTNYETPTFWRDEIAQLIDAGGEDGIPVHTFYVDDYAKADFEEIAKMTGGQTGFLDINSEAGATALTDAVTRELLRIVGGDTYVAAYDAKFGFVS